jgi:hypothetical protein
MIVEYVKERGYEGNGQDPLLTLNKTYIVLRAVFRTDGYPASVTVQVDRDEAPGVFDIDCFKVVDARIPLDWNLRTLSVGFCLEPVVFSGEFWDLYHDGDEGSEITFDNIIIQLKLFHNQE